MTLITLTSDQSNSLSQADGGVVFADPQGRVILEIDPSRIDPNRLRATTITEMIEELSEKELNEAQLKQMLEVFVPVAWYRK